MTTLKEAIEQATKDQETEKWMIESLEIKAKELGGIALDKFFERKSVFDHHCMVLEAARQMDALRGMVQSRDVFNAEKMLELGHAILTPTEAAALLKILQAVRQA